MKKRLLKRHICTAMALTLTLGGAYVQMASVTGYAAETEDIGLSYDEALRKKEEAQEALEIVKKEYDALIEEKHASEDEVVNAKRALEDAEENYTQAVENYPKGFAGFMQWVIENGKGDTEEAQMQRAEAQQVLAELALPGYEGFLGEQIPGLFSFYDVNEENMGKSSSSTNLTRMFYTIDWLEEVDRQLSSVGGPEVKTSHGAMLSAMDLATFLSNNYLNDELFGNVGKVIDFDNVKEMNINSLYGGAKFHYMLINDKVSKISAEDIPQMSHYNGTFPESLLDFTVQKVEAVGYDEEADDYIWGSADIVSEAPVMGFALGSSKYGEFIVWATADEYVSNFMPFYSLKEYISILREYFSVADPELNKTAFLSAKNNLSDAQKNLEAVDSLLSAKLAKLKDRQKEYEEAEILVARLSESIVSENPIETPESHVSEVEEIPSGEVVQPPSSVELPEGEVVQISEISEKYPEGEIVRPPSSLEIPTSEVTYQTETVEVSTGESSQFFVLEGIVLSEEFQPSASRGLFVPSVSGELLVNEVMQYFGSEKPVVSNGTQLSAARNLTPEVAEAKKESVISDVVEESISAIAFESDNELAETVNGTSQYVETQNNDVTEPHIQEINDNQIVVSANQLQPGISAKKETNAGEENTEIEPGIRDSIFAKALTYIFNGGAIALILPESIVRRRKAGRGYVGTEGL